MPFHLLWQSRGCKTSRLLFFNCPKTRSLRCVVGAHCLIIEPSVLWTSCIWVFKATMEECAGEEGAMAQIKLIWTSLSSSRQLSGESALIRKLPVIYREFGDICSEQRFRRQRSQWTTSSSMQRPSRTSIRNSRLKKSAAVCTVNESDCLSPGDRAEPAATAQNKTDSVQWIASS